MVFEIARKLAAPIERVWAAWTTASDLEQWYSPGPVNWTVDELDVRPGGTFKMHMDTPGGTQVATGTYRIVEAPTHLVQDSADGSMSIETVLESVGDKTQMVVRMEGLPDAQHDMMRGAWNGGFDKLERLLAE